METINSIKLKQVFLLMLSIAIMAVFSSCKKTSKKIGEELIESTIGNDADVNMDDEKIVIKTDEGTFTSDATANSWPKEIPKDVPEFKNGKIVNVSTRVMDEGKSWTLLYENVSKDALSEYETKLKSKGFKVNSITMGDTIAHLTAEKGDVIVIVMGGEGMASLSVSLEK